MKPQQLRTLILSSLGIAFIFGVTAYFPRFPLPGGYVHLGDLLIFLFSCLLPTPFAVCCASLGSSLADLAVGYAPYIPFTLVIKALIALCFTSKNEKFLCRRNLFAVVPAVLITCVGYYIPEVFFLGGFVPPLANVPFNALQVIVSFVLFCAIGLVFDRLHLKDKLRIHYD